MNEVTKENEIEIGKEVGKEHISFGIWISDPYDRI